MEDKQYCRVLTIAGSDSGGGAGIQADLKTFAALGCYGMSVITALTAQNTMGVAGVYEVSPEFVRLQLDSVLSDIGADAVKTGMLSNAAVIEAVADKLCEFSLRNIVVDPVMVSKSGHALLKPEAIAALCSRILPIATVLTPNLEEASVISGVSGRTRETMEECARKILDMGPRAVLVKGGHCDSVESDDCLCSRSIDGGVLVEWFAGERIETKNTHGTGCTLSSAIASYLARGKSIGEAVRLAKTYLTGAIIEGAQYSTGKGHGPVYHGWKQP